jgi:hypothetical protein
MLVDDMRSGSVLRDARMSLVNDERVRVSLVCKWPHMFKDFGSIAMSTAPSACSPIPESTF